VNDGDKNEGEPRKPGLRLRTTEVAPSLPHPSSYARRLARPLAVVGGLSQRTRRVSAVLFLFLSFRFSLFLFRFVHSVSSFVSSDVRSDSATRPRRHVTAPLKEPIALQDYSNSEHVPVARSSRLLLPLLLLLLFRSPSSSLLRRTRTATVALEKVKRIAKRATRRVALGAGDARHPPSVRPCVRACTSMSEFSGPAR